MERRAIAVYRDTFPYAVVLNTGSLSTCDAQRVLDGPEWFKAATNKLYAEHERVGGYEGDEAACDRLYHKYRSLLADLKSRYL